MKLYIQDENYHFDGFLSGVIVDLENNKTAIFKKCGMEDFYLDIDFDILDWYDLESFKMDNDNVKIKAKNYAFYKEFFLLGNN